MGARNAAQTEARQATATLEEKKKKEEVYKFWLALAARDPADVGAFHFKSI